MLDKLYILIALIVGIFITIVMIVSGFTAEQWAGTTFWIMIVYLIIGLVLRNYLKKRVFYDKETSVVITDEKVVDNIKDEEKFYVEDVEKAFFDDTDDE